MASQGNRPAARRPVQGHGQGQARPQGQNVDKGKNLDHIDQRNNMLAISSDSGSRDLFTILSVSFKSYLAGAAKSAF